MKHLYKRYFALFLMVIMAFTFISGCAKTPNSAADPSSTTSVATDYSDTNHWLSLPTDTSKPVDVFYLYPTVWHKVTTDEPNICAIDNATMLEGSANALKMQASVYEKSTNVYAPYYRQADAAYCLGLTQEEQYALLGSIPKEDVFAAFTYYLEHYNNGRPFILAGHSQGSNMLLYLLSDYMKDHPDVYNRMVASYTIGYSVTDDYLSKNTHLKFAQNATDTGVIISYNTEAPGVTANNPVLLPGANIINPLSWTTDENLVDASENLGSVTFDSGQIATISTPANAQIDKKRGVLICNNEDVATLSPGNEVFAPGIYHSQDYNFYYYNIQDNVAQRINAFLSK